MGVKIHAPLLTSAGYRDPTYSIRGYPAHPEALRDARELAQH